MSTITLERPEAQEDEAGRLDAPDTMFAATAPTVLARVDDDDDLDADDEVEDDDVEELDDDFPKHGEDDDEFEDDLDDDE